MFQHEFARLSCVESAPCPHRPHESIGFVGLGSIGGRMAERLLECGIALTVSNRTREKSEALRPHGAIVVDTPAALSSSTDVTITCLLGPDSDRDVYTGGDGLLSVDVAGKLFVNTATIGPGWACELGAMIEARGAQFVDAPIMGAGPPSARAGRLVFPVGGTADAVARAIPVLRALATTIEHVGVVGMGQVVKLANNMQVAVNAAALAQALRFAIRAGVDAEALARILPEGSSRSRAMELWLDPMVRHEHGQSNSLRTMRKDIDLAAEFAGSVGEPTSLGSAAADLFGRAEDLGLGRCGVSALIEVDPPG